MSTSHPNLVVLSDFPRPPHPHVLFENKSKHGCKISRIGPGKDHQKAGHGEIHVGIDQDRHTVVQVSPIDD